jgi:hypothetical protein
MKVRAFTTPRPGSALIALGNRDKPLSVSSISWIDWLWRGRRRYGLLAAYQPACLACTDDAQGKQSGSKGDIVRQKDTG